MSENQFDPITGMPLQTPETPAEPEAPAEAPAVPEVPETPAETPPAPEAPAEPETPDAPKAPPAPETPPYVHAARPVNPWERPQQYYQPPYYQPQPVKKEKTLTTGKFYAGIAVALMVALVLGLCGGFIGGSLSGGLAKSTGGTAVIYKTTKLKADDGDAKTPLTVEQVAELVKNSVVEIKTESMVTGMFMRQYVSSGAGSGVIITADGYIVTNNHVVENATNISVTLASGTEYEAKLIATDAKSDLAVIKVEATGLTPAAYGSSSELKVGETVVAVGNPLGELGGTVTSGIVSSLERAMTIDSTTMYLLQTDTAINPGNSGGGLFNTSGQLVGIVNAKASGEEIEGLGFAIPIDTATGVIEDLIKNGYVTGRVEPGFTFVEITDAMTAMMYRVSDLGLYVSSVDNGSDAATAGFRSGDYIVSIDGQAVSSAAAANAILDGKKPGDSATFVVKRNNAEQTITLKLTEYKPSAWKGN